MPRSYSYEFLLALQDADPTRLGVRLGRLCVEANLPAAYVAKALDVSRMTVYSWFRGQGINESKRDIVEAFMSLVQKDINKGKLPAANLFVSKAYIQEMLGRSI